MLQNSCQSSGFLDIFAFLYNRFFLLHIFFKSLLNQGRLYLEVVRQYEVVPPRGAWIIETPTAPAVSLSLWAHDTVRLPVWLPMTHSPIYFFI